jgi:uncharacterized protein (TIGR03435 family)
MNSLANHLWQSTFFAAAAALATVVLRRNSAQVRHWIWMAASIKFLLPFSWILALAERNEIHSAAPVLRAMTVERITTTFAPGAVVMGSVAAPAMRWAEVLFAVWLAGALGLACRWYLRWRGLQRARRNATLLAVEWAAPVLSSAEAMEPGVFGVVRPVLLLPEGIGENLEPRQMEAILAHELCHLRRRDNLTAALHMVVESLFWFHPLVWLIGAKLVEERERACDEAVLREGKEPGVYAQSIVNVCKLYVQSPLPCASGVTGADLKRRVREIMLQPDVRPLSVARKAAIGAMAAVILATPLAIGLLRAQTLPPAPAYTYEVVSVKPSDPAAQGMRIGPGPQNGLRTQNTTTMTLLTFAYDVRNYQITGGPSWVRDQRFDVTFTPDKAEIADIQGLSRAAAEALFARHRQRLQAVLRDRFGLVLRAETHEMPIYSLTVAKGGHKLITPTGEKKGPSLNTSSDNGAAKMTGTGVYMSMVTPTLASLLGRFVVNDTGLDGPYNFEMKWTPSEGPQDPDTAGPTIFTALTEQLGLRLEAKRGPVPVYVIEKIEKPTAN